MVLPADSHVHTEWSWDAERGSMEQTCARAVELGLPAVAFTEHVDHTVWAVDVADLEPGDHLLTVTDPDGRVRPPAFDPLGYLTEVERCRERFPGLRVLSGLELGEPHLHRDAVARVLAAGPYDRVLGSLHCLPDDGDQVEPAGLFGMRGRAPHEVVRTYLAAAAEMVATDDTFSVLAHLDYPVRSWPAERVGLFNPAEFEEEFRYALQVTAGSGRALEVSTVVPLHESVLRWWREAGGEAITFGSDAHEPEAIARGFREAAHLAETHGFRPGRDLHDLWGRV